METTKAKELKIVNHNNILASQVFITIGISPPLENVPPRHQVEAAIFYATLNDEKIFVKCIDIMFAQFDKLTDHFTLWAYGKNYDEYREWWMKQYPETKADTVMIICYYKKAE